MTKFIDVEGMQCEVIEDLGWQSDAYLKEVLFKGQPTIVECSTKTGRHKRFQIRIEPFPQYRGQVT